MSITLTINGVAYTYPSGASDTNWAAEQVAAMQALTAVANASVQVLETNVTPVGTGADTTEDNLMTYSLPANTLSTNGMGVRVTALGVGVNTADATTVRAYFGSTLLGTLVLTASQVNSWRAEFEVFRTGAATQVTGCTISNGGTAQASQTTANTASATLSGAVTLKFTGQRASSSVANSVQQLYMLVELVPAA